MKPLFLSLLGGILLLSASLIAQVPTVINYQGELTDSLGNAVADGAYSVVFTIYDAASGGTSKWTETQNVNTSGGLFAVLLGSVNPITDSVFNQPARYLGVKVGAEPEMSPRTMMVTVPWAHRVSTVDGASGGNITSKVSIGPGHTNTGIHSFVAGQNGTATGTMSTVGGGLNNSASHDYTTVAGGSSNTSSGGFATVGGGSVNVASNTKSTVAGGGQNTASGAGATVGGGSSNAAAGNYSTVGGGQNDSATGSYSTVSGGLKNVALGTWSTVGGGWMNDAGHLSTIAGGTQNQAGDSAATVGGGSTNNAAGIGSTVSGGLNNTSAGTWATVGGGDQNQAIDSASTVAGGSGNLAVGKGASVGGGQYNFARGDYSVIAGGGARTGVLADSNSASGIASVIGGGRSNVASGAYAFVGSGLDNTASNSYATVPGGISCQATGQASFAAGSYAQALHNGSFVWSDATGGWFTSTANDQFLIEASGGVGIGIENPTTALEVAGTIKSRTGGFEFPDGSVQTTSALGSMPIGGIAAWLKSYPNTPALPNQFVECNGQVLNDAASPYNGQTIPNLNGRFLRGSTASGTTGGSATHNHTVNVPVSPFGSAVPSWAVGEAGTITSSTSGSLPPYYTVVWVMRIK